MIVLLYVKTEDFFGVMSMPLVNFIMLVFQFATSYISYVVVKSLNTINLPLDLYMYIYRD